MKIVTCNFLLLFWRAEAFLNDDEIYAVHEEGSGNEGSGDFTTTTPATSSLTTTTTTTTRTTTTTTETSTTIPTTTTKTTITTPTMTTPTESTTKKTTTTATTTTTKSLTKTTTSTTKTTSSSTPQPETEYNIKAADLEYNPIDRAFNIDLQMLYRETACSSFDDCDVIFPCDYLESYCQSNIKTRKDENILIIITAESNIEGDIQTILESDFEAVQNAPEIPETLKEKLTIEIEEITVIKPTTSTELPTRTSTTYFPSSKKGFSVLEIILFSIYGFLAFTALLLPLVACRPKKNFAQFATFYLTILMAVAATATQLGFFATDKIDVNAFYGTFGLSIFFALTSSFSVMK